MSKKINAASRLLSLLKNTSNKGETLLIVDVWADIFNINEPNTTLKAILVSDRLNMMHRELKLVNKQMQEAGYSDDLYSRTTSNIENSISPLILHGKWGLAKQYLQNDTFVSLSYCSEILPDEESQIIPDELDQIQSLVDEVSILLSSSELPPRLVELINHHIELIQRALSEYPVIGAMALREAARTGLGELIEVKELVKANQNSPEMSKLGAAWKKLNGIADFALKTEKLSQLGENAWKILEKWF